MPVASSAAPLPSASVDPHGIAARTALELTQLQRRRAEIEKEIATAAAAGRAEDVARLRDLLERTNRRIALLQSAE